METNDNQTLIMDKDSNSESRESHSNPPGVLITQQLDGVKAGNTIKTKKNMLDDQNSQIHGTSVFANYIEGKSVGSPKNTDDKIVIGYTSDGLPFQIVVDGFFRGDTKATFEFIDQRVTPLMDDYAEKLSESINPEETIKDLINTIYELRSQYSSASDFTMSIGITYEKDNQLQCAGFGIGDTGLVLRKSSGETKQLTYTTSVNGFKDAFDQFSVNTTGIERVINRNSIFNTSVKSGDEIFAYTYLTEGLLSEEQKFEDNYQVKLYNENMSDKKDCIVKYRLATDNLDNNGSLFKTVKKANNDLFLARCTSAETEQKTEYFGDDCMMSTVTIPTKDLQKKLKQTAYHHEKNRLNSLLEKHDKDITSKGKRLLHAIDKLKNTENNLPKLTRHLAKSNRALINPNEENINLFICRAQKTQGKSSRSEKALGITMMVFGASLAALGGLILAGSFAALPTGIFTLPGAAGIPTGTGLAVGGTAIFSTGLDLFVHGRQKGISKNMSDFADECSNTQNNKM